MKKEKLLLCVITVVLTMLACAQMNENPSKVVASMQEMIKILEEGNITLYGDSEVTGPQWAPCAGNSQDVELKLGSPHDDGLIGAELTVVLPYIWDGECNQTEGENHYYGFGLYDPKAGTIIFDGCGGEKGEGMATVLAIQGKDVSEVGFLGEVTCFNGDESYYKLDFHVKIDPSK